MAVLDSETVDTVRLTYKLRLTSKEVSDKVFCGYQSLILLNPHLQFEAVEALLANAKKLVKAGKCDGGSIVFPENGKASCLRLAVDLDWRVEKYYNDADMITDLSVSSFPVTDMIVLFPDSLSRKERLVALRAADNVLAEHGVPKDVVALGNEQFATVYMGEYGVHAVWW